MDYEWDETKRRGNLAKHGVDFVLVAALDWSSVVITEDRRLSYGERRWLALGKIGDRVHTLIYTERGSSTRVISLRKSKRKEIEVYEQASRASDT